MNIKLYQERRAQYAAAEAEKEAVRDNCPSCMLARVSCYCAYIERFDPRISFVILIHPLEMRRKVATGRMAHLCLEDSFLIRGHDYSKNGTIDDLIADPGRHCVLLYPGTGATNLTSMKPTERIELVPQDKKLTIFVVDGTWETAKSTVRDSRNLRKLPRICFSPDLPSRFRVRKQPRSGCYSTIEAVHHTIELMGAAAGFETSTREHDTLLTVFDKMNDIQLDFLERSRAEGRASRYKRHHESA